MASIAREPGSPSTPDWRQAGLRYHALGHFYRQTFGCRVWKVSVDAGLDCPNRDGTLGRGGCIYCDPASFSPSRRLGGGSIPIQIEEGSRRLRGRHGVERFVAYFQPSTNTYAPVERLRQLYQQAIEQPHVVGLTIGTRPDCAGNEVLDLLAELAQRTWLSVEYGLQSMHDRSLAWMNRAHGYAAFVDAVTRSRQRGLTVGAHVILGLPGETADDMRATARELARLRINAVKLHNLYAVKNTPLAEMVAAGGLVLPSLEQYVGWACDFLEQLPPECVIDRLSGDAPAEYLVAPAWCRNRSAVRRAIEQELTRRDSWQGRRYGDRG